MLSLSENLKKKKVIPGMGGVVMPLVCLGFNEGGLIIISKEKGHYHNVSTIRPLTSHWLEA